MICTDFTVWGLSAWDEALEIIGYECTGFRVEMG